MAERRNGTAVGSADGPADPEAGSPVRLSELGVGRAARLHRRDLSDGEACLLAAMGLTEGCRLVVRVLGDPCIVEVRTTRIGLARDVAERLYVFAELGVAS
jgi:Fe2+ transport system protein FeoA